MRAALAIGVALLACACSSPLGPDNIEAGIKDYYEQAHDATEGTPREFPKLESVECTPANLPLDGTRWKEANDCELVFDGGALRTVCMFSTGSRWVDSSYQGRCHVVPGRG